MCFCYFSYKIPMILESELLPTQNPQNYWPENFLTMHLLKSLDDLPQFLLIFEKS